MPGTTPTIDAIKKILEHDYQATHSDQQHMLRYIKGNLHELRKDLKTHGDIEDWSQIGVIGDKIEALAINLKWDELRQAGAILKSVTEEKDTATLQRLSKKLNAILGTAFT